MAIENQDIIKETIIISRTCNSIASSLSSLLEKELEDGDITFEIFISSHNNIITPLLRQSASIVFKTSEQISSELLKHFTAISDATNSLKAELVKIQKAQKVIEVAAGFLTTVALIATFVAAPAVASGVAALASLTGLIKSMQTDVKLEEGDGQE